MSQRADFARDLARLVASWGSDSVAALEPQMAALLSDISDEQLAEYHERMSSTGGDWDYYPPDLLARRISRTVMATVLLSGSGIENPDALAPAHERNAVLLGNHLSYVDVNVLDHLMSAAGHTEIADRLTTLAGPKVFSEPIRRLASLCFGTIKLPQSTSRASGEAVMSPREVAVLARKTIRAAVERQSEGDHLLVFPEGSRSRDGQMVRCLAAVARYLEGDSALVIPWGHHGCEQLFPVEDAQVHPARVRMRFGAVCESAELLELCRGRRQLVADTAGYLIADCLPEAYRGFYGSVHEELREAREIAHKLSS